MNEGMTIKTTRVYDDPAGEAADGYRVFVDRLWPRGESHTNFKYDSWPNNLAPSAQLREWFHLDPDSRWAEFRKNILMNYATLRPPYLLHGKSRRSPK